MTLNEIKQYEAMAKLTLPDSEREWVCNAAAMLEKSFSILQSIDTENVMPLVTVLDMKNVIREDVACKLLSREEILKNSPEQSGGYFKVPKTIE